ncbi:hypothetical protein IWX90DRAFT_415638 [Phyllosticta citrichinensis]|uniref:Transcription factor Iwr1 domain-containing protein n=1 Tax=Phyllosticta citrichinensis TaxID=1130410 RepID=A0ABR1XQ37_9PEZI
MSVYEPRPKPPVLVQGGFKLDEDRFTLHDLEPLSPPDLITLLDPDSLPRGKQKAARTEARKLLKKAFFHTQMDAVRAGQCNQMCAVMLRMKEHMRREYGPMLQDWRRETLAWESRQRQKQVLQRQRQDLAFSRCKPPTERANQDVDRFIEFYFYTNEVPDPSKTPEPLALNGVERYDRMELHRDAEEVRGLHTASGGSAYQFDRRADQEKRRQREAEWEASLNAHEDYVAESRRYEGSYIIQCDAIINGYPTENELSLDICPGSSGSLEAAYDFNIIEGTMLLALSDDEVANLADSDGDEDDYDDYDGYENYEEEEEEEEEDLQPIPNGKRSAPDASGPAKRRRIEPSNPRRLYFRMKGREAREGERFSNAESGHIDFLDDDCTKFVGLMYECCLLGRNVEFKGFKVSNTPEKEPEDRSTFSGAKYEYERRARWR